MRRTLPQYFVQSHCLFACVWLVWLAPLLQAQPATKVEFRQIASGPFTSDMQVADIVQDTLGFL